jgi:hypothetical protein
VDESGSRAVLVQLHFHGIDDAFADIDHANLRIFVLAAERITATLWNDKICYQQQDGSSAHIDQQRIMSDDLQVADELVPAAPASRPLSTVAFHELADMPLGLT